MAKLPLPLRIRYLKGQAVFAQLLPGLRPGFVHRAFGVIGSGFRAGKLDGINSAEIARLVALRFQPDIFDAGDSARHVLDAVDGFFWSCINFETSSRNLYTTTCSTVFGWPKRFCTAAPRARSVPAATPETNSAAPSAI